MSARRAGAGGARGERGAPPPDFTEGAYRRLIRAARKAYPFIGFDRLERDLERRKTFVLWRHDIDYSVHRALAAARIEREEGVRATYFVQLGSFAYNPFEPEVRGILLKILRMGHWLGLHFAPPARPAGDVEEWMAFERNVLAGLLGVRPGAFSFHNPTPGVLRRHQGLRYAGMVNAYAAVLREAAGYCSDSNGYWRHGRLDDVLAEGGHRRLQVLTHPEWWQEFPMTPRERISRCIDGRAAKAHRVYDEMLERHGRANIGRRGGGPGPRVKRG